MYPSNIKMYNTYTIPIIALGDPPSATIELGYYNCTDVNVQSGTQSPPYNSTDIYLIG